MDGWNIIKNALILEGKIKSSPHQTPPSPTIT